MAVGFITGIREFLNRAEAFAHDRRGRMAVLREVDALPADERACILEEAGMGYDEFVNAMMTPFVSEDLNARALQSVGVDPSEFRTHHIDRSREMQRRCMTCAVRSRCRRDLAADVFGLQYRHYCANAESLSEIVAGMAPRAQAVRPGASA